VIHHLTNNVLHVCVQKGARNAELFANKVENTKTQMREAMIANGGAMSRKYMKRYNLYPGYSFNYSSNP